MAAKQTPRQITTQQAMSREEKKTCIDWKRGAFVVSSVFIITSDFISYSVFKMSRVACSLRPYGYKCQCNIRANEQKKYQIVEMLNSLGEQQKLHTQTASVNLILIANFLTNIDVILYSKISRLLCISVTTFLFN